MKQYKVKVEKINKWTDECIDELIVSEQEINDLASGWGKPVDELMEDVEEIQLSVPVSDNQKHTLSRATRKMFCKTGIDCDDCPLRNTRYCNVAGMDLNDDDYMEAYKIMCEYK